jgi:hypothetical protein
MFKFLLIMALIVYILSKVGGFFFKVGAASQQRQYQQPRPSDGSIHVDTPPKKAKKSAGLKGGEYIDYEEVK